MSPRQRPDGPGWGLREGGRSLAGAGRLDPSEEGEEGDEVTPLGSRPRPLHPGGGVCEHTPHCAAPTSPNPGGLLPTSPLFPVSAGRSPPRPPPGSSRPGRPSLRQGKRARARRAHPGPDPGVVKRRAG